MIVTHISRYDISGGAAIATLRLHQGLRSAHVNSRMLVRHKATHDPSVIELSLSVKLGHKVVRRARNWRTMSDNKRYIQTRPEGFDSFSDDRSVYNRELNGRLLGSDIIHLHWVAGFIDYGVFLPKATRIAPLVWTLHDMNPFTGGCHYTSGCVRYLDRCGACPQLASSRMNDLSSQIWQRKCEAYQQIPDPRLHIVTPSRWLAMEAQHSSLLSRFPVSTIPNGVDTTVFLPQETTVARQTLNLPLSARVVLTGAQTLKNRRKGFVKLTEALAELACQPNTWLLSFGKGDVPIEADIQHVHVGEVDSNQLLAQIYSAADLFIIPSLEDNLPNTVIESMACGTPVIGFDVGGIPDMIRPGITGELVPEGDVAALRRAIEALLDAPEKRKEMAANCRRIAQEEFSIETMVNRYFALYGEMLGTIRADQ